MMDTDKASLNCYKNTSIYDMDVLADSDSHSTANSATGQISDPFTPHPTVQGRNHHNLKGRKSTRWFKRMSLRQHNRSTVPLFVFGPKERRISLIMCPLLQASHCYCRICLSHPSEGQMPRLSWQSSYVLDTWAQSRLLVHPNRLPQLRKNYVYIASQTI